MTTFNLNATKLKITFISEKENEKVIWEIDEIPTPNYLANYLAESVRDSENSEEFEFTPFEDSDTYRAVIYVNNAEANIELFNDTEDEEITEFSVEEFFSE